MSASEDIVHIQVKDQKEGECIIRAMSDPETRAFVVVIGALLGLPSDRARKRVLEFVDDMLDEMETVER